MELTWYNMSSLVDGKRYLTTTVPSASKTDGWRTYDHSFCVNSTKLIAQDHRRRHGFLFFGCSFDRASSLCEQSTALPAVFVFSHFRKNQPSHKQTAHNILTTNRFQSNTTIKLHNTTKAYLYTLLLNKQP